MTPENHLKEEIKRTTVQEIVLKTLLSQIEKIQKLMLKLLQPRILASLKSKDQSRMMKTFNIVTCQGRKEHTTTSI